MKTAILLFVVCAAAFSSCTTAYKTGQTPDDVYYSPVRPQQQEDNIQKEEKKETAYNDEYYDDRYLRMKVRNHYRWNDLNDWYNYDRYSYNYNYYYGSYNNPYNSWNYYYNPYCCCHTNNIYSNPKVAINNPVTRPHNFSLGGYTNNSYNNTNSNTNSKRVYSNTYNTNNSNTNSKGFSNTVRTIFERNDNNSSTNNNSGSSSSSSRTYTPSSSSSSGSSSSTSGSSGGSSGGAVTRPVRN
jgi:uncharacterized membrane protein YgcG